MSQEETKLKIQNGFPNPDGLGIHLACELVSGEIALMDCLVLPGGLRVPVVEIVQIPVPIAGRFYQITIPREYDQSFKWFELYGTLITVSRNTEDL